MGTKDMQIERPLWQIACCGRYWTLADGETFTRCERCGGILDASLIHPGSNVGRSPFTRAPEDWKVPANAEKTLGQVACEAMLAYWGGSWKQQFPEMQKAYEATADAVVAEFARRNGLIVSDRFIAGRRTEFIASHFADYIPPQVGPTYQETGPLAKQQQRANALADECQRLKDENTKLLAENARLRRSAR